MPHRAPPAEPPVSTSTSFVAAPPPTTSAAALSPEQVELYVRSAMHQDRAPGNVLVVCHPHRMYKVPRGLFAGLKAAGCGVRLVETQPDRVRSIRAIRDNLVAMHAEGRPLDLMVVSGDGSMDHHALVAAFLAFYPDLVEERPGEIGLRDLREDDLTDIPADIRRAFLTPVPDGSGLVPDEATVRDLWLLRARLEAPLRGGRSVDRIERRAERPASDPMVRFAVLATLLPHRVTIRAHGFDVSGMVEAPRERVFKGLYPFIRSITIYPAGTAADNAVFAGTPGWGYAQLSRLLVRFTWLDGVRSWLEGRATRQFLEYFFETGIVVPERISLFGVDGDWLGISSHAAGGPAAGHFFTADLTSKTRGMLGYLARIPAVIIREGVFGSTIVRIQSRTEEGKLKAFIEAHMAEGLYTNRAFIAGVATIPTTGPTSFAGQSSLMVVPPIWSRGQDGQSGFNLRGIGAFCEAIAKGLLARSLHLVGLGVGTMAGGGKFWTLLPEHQVAIKDGEEIRIRYLTLKRKPRAVPIQVSGDPFQATLMSIHSSWAPIPVLGHNKSLLVGTSRAVLANVRLQQSYDLEGVYIGGVYYFRHHVGEQWSDALTARTGLAQPPRYLPYTLAQSQRRMLELWKEQGAGEFVDTTSRGLDLGRRGRYAHNNDQTAHLVVVREPHGILLVRQLRAPATDPVVYENRARYRSDGPAWIIHHSQTIAWRQDGPPVLVQEDHFFRNAEEFQRAAPTFFPVMQLKERGE